MDLFENVHTKESSPSWARGILNNVKNYNIGTGGFPNPRYLLPYDLQTSITNKLSYILAPVS